MKLRARGVLPGDGFLFTFPFGAVPAVRGHIDAVLMGCDDAQFRALLSEIVCKLENRCNSR